MSAFMDAQPIADRAQLAALLAAEVVEMAVLLDLDFATAPLTLCNRNIQFVDNKWGKTWGAGADLIVGLPELSGGDGILAPKRDYRLGVPYDASSPETWRADLVDMIHDRPEYRTRQMGLYGQIFDPVTSQPVGHPFAYDAGLMDTMRLTFVPGLVVVTLAVESFLSRKGLPVYGVLNYADQRHRFPTDEGLEFTYESNREVVWPTW